MLKPGEKYTLAFKVLKEGKKSKELCYRNFEDEALLTKRLNSDRAPYVLKYAGHCAHSSYGPGILLEFMDQGSLKTWLRKRSPNPQHIDKKHKPSDADPEEQSE